MRSVSPEECHSAEVACPGRREEEVEGRAAQGLGSPEGPHRAPCLP